MNVVYKYPLRPGNPISVQMPKYARVIHVGAQDDGPVLWALVDNEQPSEERLFWVYGTGHSIDVERPKIHVGTCQTDSGLVWHVFAIDTDREWAERLWAVSKSPSQSRTSSEESSGGAS